LKGSPYIIAFPDPSLRQVQRTDESGKWMLIMVFDASKHTERSKHNRILQASQNLTEDSPERDDLAAPHVTK